MTRAKKSTSTNTNQSHKQFIAGVRWAISCLATLGKKIDSETESVVMKAAKSRGK